MAERTSGPLGGAAWRRDAYLKILRMPPLGGANFQVVKSTDTSLKPEGRKANPFSPVPLEPNAR
jgi:hypothetical protein